MADIGLGVGLGVGFGVAAGFTGTAGVALLGRPVGLVVCSPRADCAGSPSAPRVAPDTGPRLLGTAVLIAALAPGRLGAATAGGAALVVPLDAAGFAGGRFAPPRPLVDAGERAGFLGAVGLFGSNPVNQPRSPCLYFCSAIYFTLVVYFLPFQVNWSSPARLAAAKD